MHKEFAKMRCMRKFKMNEILQSKSLKRLTKMRQKFTSLKSRNYNATKCSTVNSLTLINVHMIERRLKKKFLSLHLAQLDHV